MTQFITSILLVTRLHESLTSQVSPDIPTVAEAGLPGFDAKPWYGFLAPAKVSPEIVNRLNQAIREASGTPEFKARLSELGAEPVSLSPAEFQSFARMELDKWTQVSKRPEPPEWVTRSTEWKDPDEHPSS